ncbi:MAG: hydrogenase maturation nickel metallochaperone HypA, partial [Selenomonas sp.]
MSIAEGILDIALDYAKQNDAHIVHEVGLILGEMAGVEMES